MQGLITDRTQQNVARLRELAAKGWNRMTEAERAEWLGDPYASSTANLFPPGPYYASSVRLDYRSDGMVATALAGGIYLYAVSILGAASLFAGKTITLSVDAMTGGGTPQLALYWHDDNGYEYAGASLLGAGSVTVNTAEWPNAQGRGYLAMYVYVTTHQSVTAGAVARFTGTMVSFSTERQPYVPYTEVLATPCTKGAYNYSDLNRVERAVAEISALAGLGLVTKTDWAAWTVPTASDMARYIANIGRIYEYCPNKSGLPAPPLSMEQLNYSIANSIEIILLAAYKAAKQ